MQNQAQNGVNAPQKEPRTRRCRRVRTPTVLQMEIVECGAACLSMVLAYHGRYVPLERLRVDCGVTRDGVKASNIVRAAALYGLAGRGFRREPGDLYDMQPPMILHWNFNHFVVFEGFSKGKAWINDPASGHRAVTLEEFDISFTGVALTFEPTMEFQEGGPKGSFFTALGRRLAPVRNVVAFLTVIALMMVVPGILIPSFTRIFIDELMLSDRWGWLRPLLIAMGATALVQAALIWLRQKYLLRMETKIAMLGASSFLWHVLRLPVNFFQQRSPGDISSRMDSNDTLAAFLSRDLAENILGLVTVLFYFVIMLGYSVRLTFLTLALALVNVVFLALSSRRIEELNRRMKQDYGKLYGFAASGLYMIETLKATGSESGFFAKWAGHHAKQLNAQQRLGGTVQILYVLPGLLMAVAEALMLCVGGLQILDGNLSIGALVAFQGLLAGFLSPLNELTRMGLELRRLRADMARIDDVMNYEPDPYGDPQQDLPAHEEETRIRRLEGKIEVQGLTFGYSLYEPPFIQDFSISLPPGSRVALVGPSGSGKSTVASLIAGLAEPWSGQVFFDGQPRDSVPRRALTGSMAVVSQDAVLFEGTALDNLTMWDETIPYADVVQAAKDACIHEEILARDGGYKSAVEEGGANFSGGQRQRMEIARALAQNPAILILDEATSALDAITEQAIWDNIRRRGVTCLVVAHRLTTIRDCDEIVVLERGRVVQRGSHQSLLEAPGLYGSLIRVGG